MASKQNLISRLSQIVTLFQQYGEDGLTFEQVNQKLRGFNTDDNQSISLRTFQRDIKDIASSLQIKIVYNKSLKKYLLEDAMLSKMSKNTQLFTLESIQKLSIAHDINGNDFILIENRTSQGLEYYSTIKQAILDKNYLDFEYQKFDQYKSNQRKVIPLVLKEDKHRWYLVALEIQSGKIGEQPKTFALDRMTKASLGSNFTYGYEFNASDYFKDYFGVFTNPINGFDSSVDVIIETTIEYGKYFSTLPIHNSQKVSIENGKTYIALHLIPTMEFVAEILKHSNYIKVLEPKLLKKVIKETLEKNLQQYLE